MGDRTRAKVLIELCARIAAAGTTQLSGIYWRPFIMCGRPAAKQIFSTRCCYMVFICTIYLSNIVQCIYFVYL